ncbi:hypothetical protein [Bifidobacterium vespertilionis]|uniref:hypothetical protein n=1 Tax=Bifidobacterium vespertilionis TaxID=2562524 RepID=UPI001BDD736B|nr:hypothetical protein [Bifidobacterium vespertilionis]MBT1179393.1 hypothetical protein [Bifidobacterium vespertilionis]
MIAMNTPLQTKPLPASPDARLSAADALSSLSSLTDSREAVANRFTTPMWYKVSVSVGFAIATMLVWALWGGIFSSLSDLQIILCGVAITAVGVVFEVVLVWKMERRGIHWLTMPATPSGWLYGVMAPFVGIGTMTVPIWCNGMAWWMALIAAVIGGIATLLLMNMCDAAMRDYIVAGGSMDKVRLDGDDRRDDKGNELWTRARLLALPDEERRETARRLIAPVWLHPAIGLEAMLCIVSALEVVSLFKIGSHAGGFIIPVGSFVLIYALDTAVTRWTRNAKVDTRMMPASPVSWVLFFAMAVTCLIPVYFAGYGFGFTLRSGNVPLADLAVGGLVYVVLFSIFGQLYDRRRYSDIVKGV